MKFQLRERWLETRILWSDIVPRAYGRGARKQAAIELVRRKGNCTVSQWVVATGGSGGEASALVPDQPTILCAGRGTPVGGRNGRSPARYSFEAGGGLWQEGVAQQPSGHD